MKLANVIESAYFIEIVIILSQQNWFDA